MEKVSRFPWFYQPLFGERWSQATYGNRTVACKNLSLVYFLFRSISNNDFVYFQHPFIDTAAPLEELSALAMKARIDESRLEFLDGVRMEGYLSKKTTSPLKFWKQRWFAIRSNQLVYRKMNGKFELSFSSVQHFIQIFLVVSLQEIEKWLSWWSRT